MDAGASTRKCVSRRWPGRDGLSCRADGAGSAVSCGRVAVVVRCSAVTEVAPPARSAERGSEGAFPDGPLNAYRGALHQGRPATIARQVTHLPLKATFVALAIVIPATILFVRQTDDALLGVDSYWGALAEVTFWAAPGLAVYLLSARTRSAVLLPGVAIVAVLSVQWWHSATDPHSTASLGPGFVGWFYIPLGIAGWFIVAHFAHLWTIARDRDHAAADPAQGAPPRRPAS